MQKQINPAIRKHRSGTTWFSHPCVCGKEGSFGTGVNLLLAHRLKKTEYLGTWTCGKDGCESTKPVFDLF